MNYWLLKSEPTTYSWEDLVRDKRTFWDGVRNYQARNNMKEMSNGDKAFFYHSNKGKEIVGIVEVIKEAYQDPTTNDHRWVAVDIKPVSAFEKPITLELIKKNNNLIKMQLVRSSRLSVSKVSREEWNEILSMTK